MNSNQNPTIEDQLMDALGLQKPEPETVTEPATDPAPSSTEPATDPEPQPQAPQENATIKQMREQIKATKANESKYKALLDRIATANGTTVEELEAKIQAQEDKKIAEQKNIPVEVQASMREQSERIRALEEQLAAQTFNAKANSLMAKYSLSPEQFLEFANTAVQNGFDIKNPNLNMEMLYKSINYDNLVNSAKAAERQAVLAEIEKQKQSTSTTTIVQAPPAKQTTPSNNNNNVTKDEQKKFMEDLLAAFK